MALVKEEGPENGARAKGATLDVDKSRDGCVESAVVAAADGASVSTVTLCDSITFHDIVVEET